MPAYSVIRVIDGDTFETAEHQHIRVASTEDKFVNEAMLSGGYSYYYPRSNTVKIGKELKSATEKARQKRAGIFSHRRTQTTNTEKPSCNVKGNTRTSNIYYLPGCGVYDNVEVQLYLGDRWFCDEPEAVKAGFRKPAQCP